jgi:hypothetical protein
MRSSQTSQITSGTYSDVCHPDRTLDGRFGFSDGQTAGRRADDTLDRHWAFVSTPASGS